MKKLFTFIAICITSANLLAQTYDYRSAQNPHYWKNKMPNGAYWQQDVLYKIKANLDDKTDIITASEELTYYNNSPDTLTFVYFHLYQNAFIKGAYLENLNLANNFKQKFGKYEANGQGTTIDNIAVNGVNLKTSLDNSIIKVWLTEPILPNGQCIFNLNFKTYFDDGGNQRRRMKMYKDAWGNKHFNGVHWYPRICVYDRKFGWETDQHLGKEFYGDFGQFELELSFPNNYILDGTGELQNESEVLPTALREKLDLKNFAKKPWDSAPDSTIIKRDGSIKTWKFRSVNTHDIAWSADPTYRIGEVQLPLKNDNNRIVRCIALVQEPHASGWQDAALFCSKIIELYSNDIGVYAYPKMIVADAADGMEYPMITLDGGRSPGYYGLFAHEIGHNWFFGMVGNNETYRASLDEGFTQFLTHWSMSRLFQENPIVNTKNKYIKKYYRPLPLLDQNVYLGYVRDAINEDDPALNTHSDDFNGALNHGGGYGNVYYKTATMLYNLQYVLGEDLFQKSLQHYFNQWKMAHPYFEDFRASIIQYSKTDLNWFFDQWLETSKHTDYSVDKVKLVNKVNKVDGVNGGTNFEIQFSRKGLMQMPVDFTVFTKDSSFKYLIPNTYFAKKTNATILPTWKGWGILNETYTAKISLPVGSKITNIQIDPSYRLADINQLDNSLKCPVLFTFDHQIGNSMDRKHYILKWRPDVWYNNYDGVKVGLHLNGNYMNQKHVFSFTTWYNTALATNYNAETYKQSSNIYPAHFILSYRHRVAKQLDFDLQSRLLDGLFMNKIGFNKTIHNTIYRVNIKSMRRVQKYYLPAYSNININGLSFYPDITSYDQWNNTLNLEMDHNYNIGIGAGKVIIGMRTSAIFSDFDYASLYLNLVQYNNLHKFELKTRIFAQYMSGTNAAPESQLYLAGANMEEMVENKFTRSAGILPASWFDYGASTNHFQMGGGLNIRGFAGYLLPVNNGIDQYFLYKGNSGASVSLELDYDKYFNIPARGIFKNLHLDSYLFLDAGILKNNAAKISESNSQTSVVTTNLLASAGPGFALTIKRWSYFDGIKPFTIRFDMPLYLSNIPYVESENIKFRWQFGINRCF